MDFARIIAAILAGASTISDQIRLGDEAAAKSPELLPLWEVIRAKLLAVQSDPALREKVALGLAVAWNTVVELHGEVGPSQAHHG